MRFPSRKECFKLLMFKLLHIFQGHLDTFVTGTLLMILNAVTKCFKQNTAV